MQTVQWPEILLALVLTAAAAGVFEIVRWAVRHRRQRSGRHAFLLRSPRFNLRLDHVPRKSGFAPGQVANDCGPSPPRPGTGGARRALVRSVCVVAVAGASVGGFSLLRAWLTPALADQSPFLLYILPILLCALFLGPQCGALAMLASGVTGLYAFVEPRGEFSASRSDLAALLVFWIVSGSVILTASALRLMVIARARRLRRRRLRAKGVLSRFGL